MNRRLLNIERIANHYQVAVLAINYKDDNVVKRSKILAKKDIYIDLKCWIAWDPDERQVYISQRLINAGNHWINTLKDDLKNNRIDPNDYYA